MGKLLAVDLLAGLSGLLSSLVSEITRVATDIAMAGLKLALALIVGALKGVFCVLGYTISAFILSLIDFMETIFRLLAGMPVDGQTLTIGGPTWGNAGENSDLLVQLIRNDDIQQAFLAMCIVGIFLLVMTTIFQMIKVEYTTEGAKNAKGPILEKAFKGLANLLLIPILCIFGVMIGNQILGLLDTATKGTGESPSIGGALFVAACGDARYQANELRCIIDPNLLAGVAATGGAGSTIVLTYVVGYSTVQTFIDYYNISEGKEDKVFDPPAGNPYVSASDGPLSYDQIDNNFINGVWGFKYTNMGNVTSYYNFLDINYILLIIGGCICVKCLYNVCFGMILRLYYCTALFILSPIVIGMSPVTDNMGKWRTAFIGKAISAYGVVISMNLFFTIIKVLLSIDISFDTVLDYSFGSEFAVGIIKGIIVLGGCLMIEKWSKEFGAYFGAEDALSTGAAFAKETGELAKNAVKTTAVAVAAVAAGVMTAGAGSAAVAGIAGKVGMLAGKAGGALGKAGTALAGKGGIGKVAGNVLSKAGSSVSNVGANASAYAQKRVKNVAAENAFKDRVKEQEGIRDTALGEADNNIAGLQKDKSRLQSLMDGTKSKPKLAAYKDQMADLDSKIAEQEKKKQDANKTYADWEKSDEFKEMKKAHDDSQNADAFNADERMVNRGKFTGALGGLARRNGLIGSVWGGLDDAKKEMEGYEKNGGTGAEFEAALASVQGERKDREEAKYNRKNAYDIEIKQKTQNRILNDAITEAMKVQTDELRRNGQKMVDELNELRKALEKKGDDGKYHYGNHTFDKNDEFYKHLQQRMYAKEDAIKEAGVKEVNGKVEVDIKGTDAIQSAMTKAIAEGWNTKKITDELTRIFEEQGAAGNKKLLEEILKAIEKVKGSAGGGK